MFNSCFRLVLEKAHPHAFLSAWHCFSVLALGQRGSARAGRLGLHLDSRLPSGRQMFGAAFFAGHRLMLGICQHHSARLRVKSGPLHPQC